MGDTGTFRDYFNAVIEDDIQRDIVKYVWDGYAEADSLVKDQDYQPGPAKNLFPYVRWAAIDNKCLALNNKYQGLLSSSKPNFTRNSFYTLIELGNVRMTISAVSTSNSLPREALFRNDLASCRCCFDISEDESKFEFRALKDLGDSIFYASVVHGATAGNPRFPAFIQIGFPNEHCTKYVDKIDLLKKFPDLAEELLHEDMVRIEDMAQITLNLPQQERLL